MKELILKRIKELKRKLQNEILTIQQVYQIANEISHLSMLYVFITGQANGLDCLKEIKQLIKEETNEFTGAML